MCGKGEQTLDHKPKSNEVKAHSLPALSPQFALGDLFWVWQERLSYA